jgi:hypothetical protein
MSDSFYQTLCRYNTDDNLITSANTDIMSDEDFDEDDAPCDLHIHHTMISTP